MKKTLFVLLLICLGSAAGGYYWVEQQSFKSTMSSSNIPKEFEIKEGDGSVDIGINLEQAGLIKSKYYFYYYVWRTKGGGSMQVGMYALSPNMTIGEMVSKFSRGDIVPQIVKLTIPEGFTNKKIIARIREQAPEIADEFEKYASCKCINQTGCECDIFSTKYAFLQELPAGVDMEGYLFPDTYFIEKEDTGASLISKMLTNFQRKTSGSLREEIEKQNKTLVEIVTMASLIEKEAKTPEDQKIVSGIFWKRIADQHPLQSCATLAYISGVDKDQYSYEDTQMESPYNTYLHPGLPVGPVTNPGLATLQAAVFPKETDYYFFLSDPRTKAMVYSKTGAEHNENKAKHGL